MDPVDDCSIGLTTKQPDHHCRSIGNLILNMNDHLTTIRIKHISSCNSYDAEPQRKSYTLRRRPAGTASSAKNLVTEPNLPREEPLKKPILQNRSDKNIRGRILLPKSKHLPQNFFDDRLFLRLDRSRQKNQSPKDTNVDTPTFRELGDITFCEQPKSNNQKRKLGRSEVLRRKQPIDEDKENRQILANLDNRSGELKGVLPLRKSFHRQYKPKQGDNIFQPKVSLFQEGEPASKPRLQINASDTRTRRLKLSSYLPQLKLRNIG